MTEEGAPRREIYRPSASGIERSLSCILSAVLPRPPEAPRAHNAPASRGDRIHKAFERWSLGARWEDVEHMVLPYDCYNLREVCEKAPKLEPIKDMPSAEAEFWLDPMSGEARLGTAEVKVPAGFWRGRADRIGWYEHPEAGRVPCVLDLKSGNPLFQIEGGAAQLAYFAVCLHILMERAPIAGIAYLSQDPDRPRVHLFDAAELVQWFRRFHDHEARLTLLEQSAEMPEAYPSQKNCIFCPAKATCPSAWRKAAGDGQ